MDMVNKPTQTPVYMKANGRATNDMAKVYSPDLTLLSTKEVLKMT